MTLVEVVVGLAILVGLAGIVVPVLPGTVLILVAVLVWATETGGATAWTVLGGQRRPARRGHGGQVPRARQAPQGDGAHVHPGGRRAAWAWSASS